MVSSLPCHMFRVHININSLICKSPSLRKDLRIIKLVGKLFFHFWVLFNLAFNAGAANMIVRDLQNKCWMFGLNFLLIKSRDERGLLYILEEK